MDGVNPSSANSEKKKKKPIFHVHRISNIGERYPQAEPLEWIGWYRVVIVTDN